MANRLISAAWGPLNIAAATTVYTYTATTNCSVRFYVYLGNAVGGGDYVCYLTKRLLGAGSTYTMLPKTTATAAAGELTIGMMTITVDMYATDVVNVVVDGLALDNAVNGTIQIYEDSLPTVDLAAAADAVWDELLAGHIIADSAGLTLYNLCACVASNLLARMPGLAGILRGVDFGCLYRGDTWGDTITGLGDLTGATDIWLAFKTDPADADSAAVMLISLSSGLEVINGAAVVAPDNLHGSLVVNAPATGGSITWYLSEVESAKVVPAKLYYDVQKRIAGVPVMVSSPKAGRVTIEADISRATS